ncbi:MAG TPA: hypothetical protein VH370_23100 [Humisphaera sp.]|nr:hypothetical protein [Humisphaera sp.]
MRALRRRQTLIRLLEAGGVSLAAGCLISLPILAHEIWRHQSSSALPPLVLIVFSFIGMTWAWSRRPSLLAVAVEADRQLGLKELLATSLHCGHCDPAFAESLRQEAERRAAKVRPSQVHLARMTLRSWSGIGLLLALVLSLNFAAHTNSSGREVALNEPAHSSGQSVASAPDRPLVDLSLDSGRRARVEQDPEDPDASKFGQHSASPNDAATTRESIANAYPPRSNQRSSAGVGSGMSRSDPSRAHSVPTTDLAPHSSANPAVPTGQTGSGSGPGRSGNAGANADATASGVVVAPNLAKAADWHSGAWQAQVDRARQSLQNGQVPPAYRELVREYFR